MNGTQPAEWLTGEQVKTLLAASLAVECPACGAAPGERCWQMIRVNETRAVRQPGPGDRKRRAQRTHQARVDSVSPDLQDAGSGYDRAVRHEDGNPRNNDPDNLRVIDVTEAAQ